MNFYLISDWRRLMLSLIVVFISATTFSQIPTPASYLFDENSLAKEPGTVTVQDVAANGGAYITRPATAPSATMWYGPYSTLKGGNYLLQFRMKVSSNTSSAYLLHVDMVSFMGGGNYGSLNISPNMFKGSNEWQLFTIPVSLPDNITNYEIRGIGFHGGITDLSLDYVSLIPGTTNSIYSNDLTVTGDGKVGIGTQDTKGYELAVNGRILSTEIKVAAQPWPDYVFKSNYSLTPLKELEQYIKANGHLPDIPKATDVEKDGINVGEMNAKLLRKIEELTLHVIQLKKELDEVKGRASNLEAIGK